MAFSFCCLFLIRIRQLTHANNELRRQLEEIRGSSSAEADSAKWPKLSAPQTPPVSSTSHLHSLNVLRAPVFPLHVMPVPQKSLLRIAPLPCVKSINGVCFCINCIITESSNLKENNDK